LLRWRLDTGVLEPGVWVRKKLYPRRCDLSDDGELLLYYLSGGINGAYAVLCGLSRVPWLHPLESWDEGDTWGRGWTFSPGAASQNRDPTRVIETSNGRVPVRRNEHDVGPFINELRRGWSEATDCPPRHTADYWNECRNLILEKTAPTGDGVLRLIGGLFETDGGMDGWAPSFESRFPARPSITLSNAAWADWDHRGRLLFATKDGRICAETICDGVRTRVEEHDLSAMTPDPQPAPEWATALPPPHGPGSR